MKTFSFDNIPADFADLIHDSAHIGHCPWSGCHVSLIFLIGIEEEWGKTNYQTWVNCKSDRMVLVVGQGYSDPLGFDEDLFSRKMKKLGGNPEEILGKSFIGVSIL
jgi:hypothetical protein